MAATVYMNTNHRSTPHRSTVRVSTVRVAGTGAFGRAVAAQLATAPGAVHTTVPGTADEAGVLVVALWRPSPELCERLDAEAFAAGRPWLPVVAAHPHLLAGPLVVPPEGPCFRCSADRRAALDPQPDLTARLHAAYDADPALGPEGYLPQHVRIAAALTTLVLRRGIPGLIAAHDVHTGHTTSQRITGMDGCTRCDAGAAAGRRDGSGRARFVRGSQ
ncbi:MAG: hypothetical protein QOJ50_3157 [Cryptosporangiaceae bacterium]|nr:hypothetical protein [Cryptosporangiaceae bacterium]